MVLAIVLGHPPYGGWGRALYIVKVVSVNRTRQSCSAAMQFRRLAYLICIAATLGGVHVSAMDQTSESCRQVIAIGKASSAAKASRNAQLKLSQEKKDYSRWDQVGEVTTSCEQKWLWRCSSKVTLCPMEAQGNQ